MQIVTPSAEKFHGSRETPLRSFSIFHIEKLPSLSPAMKRYLPIFLTLSLLIPNLLLAELKIPAIIADHMVLQQKQANPIWGWDAPGTEVTVTFGDQVKKAKAGNDGKWTVKLDPVDANADPATLKIDGSSSRVIKDVLVGEVWMCSGQSNMGWTVMGDWKWQVESLASNHPNLRLITVPRVGTQELQNDFKGEWKAATPETVKTFSAVGFYYGRYLHEILGVPVGLINNAWGGSAAEAWVKRESIDGDERFNTLTESWKNREAQLQSAEYKAKYETALAAWKTKVEEAKAAGKTTATSSDISRGDARREFASWKHFRGHGSSDNRIWNEGRDLVPGRKQREPGL